MTLLIVAYADEYPWLRCPCGYMVNRDPRPCPGCGNNKEQVEFRDRFSSVSTVKHGITYLPVTYEDAYRR